MAVKQFIEVKFRPATAEKAAVAASGPANLKGASRVQIRKDSLIELTGSVENGRLCYIEKIVPEGAASEGPARARREAVLWLTPDPNLGRAVAKVSRSFQEAAGLNYTDTYRIVAAESAPEVANDVVFEDITPADSTSPIQAKWMASWVANLKAELDMLDLVFPGMVLKDITFMRQKRTFAVRSVNGLQHNDCRVVPETNCTITATAEVAATPRPPPSLQVAAIEGLEEQVRELNCFLRDCSLRWADSSLGTSGLVLQGGSGTGKSMVLDRIADTGWGAVHRIRPTDKSTAVADIFKACRVQPRNIVLIDDLDKLIDKERANRSTVINALADGLDAVNTDLRSNKEAPLVAVVAACRDYITSIPEDLRRNGRFEMAVLLPPLDAKRRHAVISSLTSGFIHQDARLELISNLSERTHAYNGCDLCKLVLMTRRLVLDKMALTGLFAPDVVAVTGTGVAKEPKEEDNNQQQQPSLPRDPAFYRDVLEAALLKVRPTAMQDVNLKPPPMRWDDISGQDTVKRELQLAVDMLTRPLEELQAFISTPPKGFLLYGPPGCSKTMTAQAMATECGLNFFAVKGAELLNMYVGESERRLDPDVDMSRLVELTKGNSGAEVVSACHEAGTMAYQRWIGALKGEHAGEGGSGGGGDARISMLDLETAIAGQRKLITADMLQAYADWERQFR
ncbi:ATPase [Magnaporthiopsis poae ATCC 64411]|uniref:ATPase n=1 Tax=Magnaporthiopsis poae (strain ATCC 64411 / 73-15) TaxID=644358 RepID=A0A0C4DPM7_MAGP6|nr:ATPase [Magnaporthiopsis poae ATCC 64411]